MSIPCLPLIEYFLDDVKEIGNKMPLKEIILSTELDHRKEVNLHDVLNEATMLFSIAFGIM